MSEQQMKKQKVADYIRREYGKIIGFIRRQQPASSYYEAEDVLGDVLVSIFQLIHLGSLIDNIPSYLYRSIKNKLIDIRKKKETRETLRMEEPDEGLIRFSDTLRRIESEAERKVELAELKEILHTALRQLKEKQRAVWMGTEVQGVSYTDLSRRLGISTDTLYVIKKRANDKIKEYIEKYHTKGGTR